MGIPSTAKDLPAYPAEDEEWPLHPTTQQRLTRFRWDLKWNEEPNWATLKKVSTYVKDKGAIHLPAAKSALDEVSEKDCFERVKGRFIDLATAVKKTKKESGEVDGEDGDPDEKKKRTRQTRQKSKFEVRKRKRESLQLKDPLRDPKYDKAMAYTLMSGDEDDPNGDNFISRKPTWRSEEANSFYLRIDAVNDPKPGKRYTKRVRGEPVDEPVPWTNKLELRARRWMVDVAWLEEPKNKQYDVPNRIAGSGKLWGDKDDPEDLLAKEQGVKKAKLEKGTLKRSSAAATGSGTAERERKRTKSGGELPDIGSQGVPGANVDEEW
ncbi:hypothetical protein AAF712_016794 [Marasmius tenuissimus]|uniref:Uncharacterized protein n=1 Tax=Marasmius tenuissimus TaxID=585030 RepID=A0ABR2Z5W8_9AGAR